MSFVFAQGESPLTKCYTPIPFYVGLNSGVNLSKVNYSEHTINLNTSYQIGLEIESFIRPINNWEKSILYGLSYESKNFNIKRNNKESKNINAGYLTFPIKYHQELFRFLDEEIIFRIQLGGFYSFLINSSIVNTNSFIPNSNYGIILGATFTYTTSIGLYFILDYNFQNGFAPIDNTTQFNSNISHVINIGFKVPSTSIF